MTSARTFDIYLSDLMKLCIFDISFEISPFTFRPQCYHYNIMFQCIYLLYTRPLYTLYGQRTVVKLLWSTYRGQVTVVNLLWSSYCGQFFCGQIIQWSTFLWPNYCGQNVCGQIFCGQVTKYRLCTVYLG